MEASKRMSILSRSANTSSNEDKLQDSVRKSQHEKAKTNEGLLTRRNFREPEFNPALPPAWFAILQKKKAEALAKSNAGPESSAQWITLMNKSKEVREKIASSRDKGSAGQGAVDPSSSPWLRLLRAGSDESKPV